MDHRTKVDWYAGRTRTPPAEVVAALQPMFGPEGKWLHLKQKSSGWQGYAASAEVRIADVPIGLAAWGGAQQREWMYFSVSGTGCDYVRDWDVAQECFDQLQQWEPRRVDIALDTFKRETGYEAMKAAYAAGGFVTQGRPPRARFNDCSDPLVSRKVTIGERTGDKYTRGYEKGLQLAQGRTEIDGIPVEDWFRTELELKAKSGPLPADIIDRRDQYFAGAYPYLQQLLSDVEPEILIQTRERVPQLFLQDQLNHVRRMFGSTLFTALQCYGGDYLAVWDRVVGDKHSAQLLAAGVLMVEHS